MDFSIRHDNGCKNEMKAKEAASEVLNFLDGPREKQFSSCIVYSTLISSDISTWVSASFKKQKKPAPFPGTGLPLFDLYTLQPQCVQHD